MRYIYPKALYITGFLVFITVCAYSVAIHNNDSTKFEPDTNYYYKYSNRLVLGIYQSRRSFRFTFEQNFFPPAYVSTDYKADSSFLDYYADARYASGFDISYDKFSISFNTRTVPPDNANKKGKTYYNNFQVNFGGNKWMIETSTRYFRGFYEMQSLHLMQADTTISQQELNERPYYLKPNMSNLVAKGKFFYFTNNKKFSYRSAYSGVYRQLKSAFSPIISGNIYFNRLSSDTNFISPYAAPYWDYFNRVYSIHNIGISAGGGITGTLVLWRAIFVNLMFTLNTETQFRKYFEKDKKAYNLIYQSWSGDLRASIGVNAKNFYISLNSMNDFYLMHTKKTKINSNFISVNFVLGYRFKIKEPKFMSKIRNNRFYKML